MLVLVKTADVDGGTFKEGLKKVAKEGRDWMAA